MRKLICLLTALLLTLTVFVACENNDTDGGTDTTDTTAAEEVTTEAATEEVTEEQPEEQETKDLWTKPY